MRYYCALLYLSIAPSDLFACNPDMLSFIGDLQKYFYQEVPLCLQNDYTEAVLSDEE